MNKHIASGSARTDFGVEQDLFSTYDELEALKNEYKKLNEDLTSVKNKLKMSPEGRQFLEVRSFHD